MPDATELCSTADLKTLLAITSATQDTLLALVKASVEQMVKTYCGRDFLVASYTEYHDGDGGASLRLDQAPIVSITTIHADPARLFEAASLIPASDIILDDKNKRIGWVDLYSYKFTKGTKGIKVVYSAGYSTVPTDLSMAVKLIVCREFKVADKKLFAEVTQVVGDTTITLAPDTWPKNALAILEKYRRVEL